jgi:hypothetical protein
MVGYSDIAPCKVLSCTIDRVIGDKACAKSCRLVECQLDLPVDSELRLQILEPHERPSGAASHKPAVRKRIMNNE